MGDTPMPPAEEGLCTPFWDQNEPRFFHWGRWFVGGVGSSFECTDWNHESHSS